MRRVIITVLISFILGQVLFVPRAMAREESPPTLDEVMDKANLFMEENFGAEDYFGKRSKANRPINKDLATKGIAAFEQMPVLIYGSEEDGVEAGTAYGNDRRKYDAADEPRALGFSYMDSPYPNPQFYIDDVNYVRRWIKEPWILPEAHELGIIKTLTPDHPADTHRTQWLAYQPDTQAATYSTINKWITDKLFLPDQVEIDTGNRKFFNPSIEGLEGLPADFMANPQEYIYIIQPPTYDSWGVGLAFYYYGGTGADNMYKPNNYSYYQYFRYKPFSMLEDDLSVHFDPIPSGALVGHTVTVGVSVQSTFDEDLESIAFAWEVEDGDGRGLNISEDGLTFSGDARVQEGIFDISKDRKEKTLYATFTMPDKDVRLKFSVNEDGSHPKETIVDNNRVGFDVIAAQTPVESGGDFELDFNILSKKIQYALPTNSVDLGSRNWTGPATGNLKVINTTPYVLQDFYVENNPPVFESSSTISRIPEIHATIKRHIFGDRPTEPNGWLNLSNPWVPKLVDGMVDMNGSVSRPYKYTSYCSGCRTNADGDRYCSGHTRHSTARAHFDSGQDTQSISARIYNGRARIEPKIYNQKIENNDIWALKKNLFWTSEPYALDVIRWMCHEDEDGALYGWRTVPGQYQRIFTQQNSGEIEWAIKKSQEASYSQSRYAAMNKYYSKYAYDKAVFASDDQVQNQDYPIKSGYYFNPTGEYTFTLETVTYKPTRGATRDHEDLVSRVIDGFRYETDLIYINQNQEAVNLQNERLWKSGGSYLKRSAIITAQDPTGVDEAVLLKVLDGKEEPWRYTKTVEALEHTEDSFGYTHDYFKNILEGYAASGTQASKDDFKYREYIKDGQHIYRITEKTRVTIQINPDNRKVYTHAHMPNGDYSVRVWIDDLDLNREPHTYASLDVLKGITSLDEIEISVKGSMYDDLNN